MESLCLERSQTEGIIDESFDLDRILTGSVNDPKRFGQFVEACEGRVRAIVQWVLHDVNDVQDAVQENYFFQNHSRIAITRTRWR